MAAVLVNVPEDFKAACSNGDLERVRELLSIDTWARLSPDDLYEALRQPATLERPEVVRELLAVEGWATLDQPYIDYLFEIAFKAQCPIEVARDFLALKGSRAVSPRALATAVENSCMFQHAEVVRMLLAEQGARTVPVEKFINQFHQAAKYGYLAVVREFLALPGERALSATAVQHAHSAAVERGDTAMAELLASDVRMATGGGGAAGAAFLAACRDGRSDEVSGLLELKAEDAVGVLAKVEEGFLLACKNGHVDIVRELLSMTGDRAIPAAAVEAARAAAAEGGQEAVVEVLAAHSE